MALFFISVNFCISSVLELGEVTQYSRISLCLVHDIHSSEGLEAAFSVLSLPPQWPWLVTSFGCEGLFLFYHIGGFS